MKRRAFVGAVSLSASGLVSAVESASAHPGIAGSDYDRLSASLLKEWCDALLEHQVNKPADPKLHGMLQCPVCDDVIHGRCWESMYPLMHMAAVTGDQKYLDAAIHSFEWSKNVSWPDGRWTSNPDPDSWPGISVFGALALAESINYHGDLLSKEQLAEWRARLALGMDGYIAKNFTKIKNGNINYGMTSLWAFNLIGRVLGNEEYVKHSYVLAKDVLAYFTKPNKFIFGEGKPTHERSAKGLLRADLGYNVEESLNGLVAYALKENDTGLLDILTTSMNSHLDFMLPDGAWDNSWGTRQAKWSYWGSRTSDGCQPAFSMMADRNPAFGTAAFKNLELLKRCTHDGLLHGGLHYVSHGIGPCIHHTFTHAKALAFIQDHKHSLPNVNKSKSLPRAVADGIKTVPEFEVSLVARGSWRATVSVYDALYTRGRQRGIQQATGGSLAVLYHNKVGPLFTASMANYVMVEANNMQPQPNEDFALTPRVEVIQDGVVFNNLYDLTAQVKTTDDGKAVRCDVAMGLYNKKYKKLSGGAADYKVSYRFDEKTVTIQAETADGAVSENAPALILPLLSQTGEAVKLVSDKHIEVVKSEGTVVLESSAPLKIKKSEKERLFNMVPGMECIPISIELPKESGMKVSCKLSVA